jgi:hypothetical protein
MPAEQLADKVLLPTKEVEGATGELAFVVTEVRLDPLDRMVSPSPDELGTLGLGSVIGAEKGLDLGQSRGAWRSWLSQSSDAVGAASGLA